MTVLQMFKLQNQMHLKKRMCFLNDIYMLPKKAGIKVAPK